MKWIHVYWRTLLSHAPLPMLALAASYGVYQYALLFVPQWVAIAQAAAFEATYIGLAVVRVPEVDRRKRARRISFAAVAVSVVYNSAAGYFHRNPDALMGLSFGEELGLAIAHGAPLAIVAFLVADLLLHASQPATDVAAVLAVDLVPQPRPAIAQATEVDAVATIVVPPQPPRKQVTSPLAGVDVVAELRDRFEGSKARMAKHYGVSRQAIDNRVRG
jgi:hypothetical protein